jgi:hypothetical protein
MVQYELKTLVDGRGQDDSLQAQLTWGGQLAISTNGNSSGIGDQFDLILTDMRWDPFDPLRRFAVGEGGVFMTIDGATWVRLLHTGALAGRPANCYYDAFSTPEDPALYVAFAGRGLVKITQLQEGSIHVKANCDRGGNEGEFEAKSL